MAQTKEGALKAAAGRLGITAKEYTENAAAGLKHCMRCRAWRAVADFNRDATRHDGLAASCRGCTRVQVRKNLKGRVSSFKGRTHTAESKAAMSAAKKGKPGNRKGARHTAEARAKISAVTKARTARGASHYAFTHGRHQRDKCDRRTTAYKEWRKAVYERDRYTCKVCGDASGGNLQAHHIKDYASHPDLRLVVSNGATICQDCHERLHLKPIPMFKCRRKKHPHPAPLDDSVVA